MSTMDFTVRAVTSAQWPALEDLFGRSGASNGCWCMYWRIGPRYPVDTTVPSHTPAGLA
jgi:hypothetical protein